MISPSSFWPPRVYEIRKKKVFKFFEEERHVLCFLAFDLLHRLSQKQAFKKRLHTTGWDVSKRKTDIFFSKEKPLLPLFVIKATLKNVNLKFLRKQETQKHS